ncbi:MAG: MmgE/PrpD family protein [Synergistales bacterium]
MIFETDYRLENFILGAKWEDFPGKVRDRAVVCSIDLMMALLLGSRGKQHEVGLKLAKQVFQGGEVPVVGSGERLSFLGATMAMGHASNSFDIDDGHNMIKGHPGTSFVGGILSSALERDISYTSYLTALVVAYEVAVRWALALQNHYGFLHSTGAYGAFGTAAGVGRIFGLGPETLNRALSIADFHAPLAPVMHAVEYPSMNKDAVPFGTLVGAIAVMEAMAGYIGKTHLLEMPEYRHLLDTLGSRYEITNLYFKPFTCCRWAHQPIAACLALMKDHGFSADEVEHVKVNTFVAASRLSKIVPTNTDEAQYNIAYPVAAALVHGDVGYSQVCDEALGNEKVLGMMKKLEFVVDPAMENQFPQKRLAWVEIRLESGKVLQSEVFAAPGEASDNVDMVWITEKFKRITRPFLCPGRQEKWLSLLSKPGDLGIREVVEELNRD